MERSVDLANIAMIHIDDSSLNVLYYKSSLGISPRYACVPASIARSFSRANLDASLSAFDSESVCKSTEDAVDFADGDALGAASGDASAA